MVRVGWLVHLTYRNDGSLLCISDVRAFRLRIRVAFASAGRLRNALILSMVEPG